MPFFSSSGLSDSARIWIYGAARELRSAEVRALDQHMARFMTDWQSHGRPVTPHWELAYGWFVVIGVDQAAFSLSGCSIDSMFRALEDFNRASGLDFTNSGGRVFYRDASGEIQSADRFDFGDRAKRRQVDADTVVFNNTVSTLGDLNAGKWEMPMRDSWHMDVFGKSLAT